MKPKFLIPFVIALVGANVFIIWVLIENILLFFVDKNLGINILATIVGVLSLFISIPFFIRGTILLFKNKKPKR